MRPWSFPVLGSALVAASLLGGLSALPPGHAGEAAPCNIFYMPSAGLACKVGPGLYEFFGPDGRSVGFGHGPDPVAGGPPCATPTGSLVNPLDAYAGCAEHAQRMPHCVDGDPNEAHTKVLYVRSFDDGAGFRYPDDTIRLFVRMMDGAVDESGMVNGDRADLRVLCRQGDIAVERITIGQPMGLLDFASLVQSLQALGHNEPHVKYLVYYDDAAPGIAANAAGQGSFVSDDRLVAGNVHNGVMPMYAVSWDSPLHTTLLHELGHNMGAVQLSAPHSSLGAHCYDSLDVMCYDDDGQNSTLYGSLPDCPRSVWDCGLDDYFNTRPGATWPQSYLRTHWNIGDPINRFVALRGSTMDRLACAGDVAAQGVPFACTFLGGNPGATTVTYRIDWGDGTVQTVAGRPLAPQTATHAYAAPGAYRVEVSATDDTMPNASGLMPWDVRVQPVAQGLGDCPEGPDCPVDIW